MSIPASKVKDIQFLSSWDINRVVKSGQKNVTVSTGFPPPRTVIDTYTGGPSQYIVYVKHSNGRWYPSGSYNEGLPFTEIDSGTLYTWSYFGGTYNMRYYIFNQKVV